MKIGKVVKFIFAALFIVFMAAVILRIFMLKDSRTLSDIYPTDAAKTAYAEDGSSAFLTHKPAEEISSDGYYSAYAMVYAPEEKELQLTVRYNDSLPERYMLGSIPENYAWELRDVDGTVIAKGTVLDTAEKYRYNYVRVAFNGVEIDNDDELYLFLISDEVQYPEADTEGLRLHGPENSFKTYKPDKNEKNALEAE